MTSDSLRSGIEGSSLTDKDVAICKRPGCGKPVPATTRGRTRQFCSNECARRYHNDARATARRHDPEADDPLSALDGLLRQSLAHLRAAREQSAGADIAELRAQLAEAQELRRRAEADAATAAAALDEAREEASAARADAERYARERDAARTALVKRVPAGRLPHGGGDHHQGPASRLLRDLRRKRVRNSPDAKTAAVPRERGIAGRGWRAPPGDRAARESSRSGARDRDLLRG